MLSMIKKTDETVSLKNNDSCVSVKVLKIEKNKAQLGVQAPKDVEICRTEIYKRNKAELAQQLEAYYYQNIVSHDHLKMPGSNMLSQIQDTQKLKKILLIEDNPIIRKVHCSALQTDYIVDIAENGKQALALFDSSYDLILLDIGLPDIKGTDLCRTIRKKECEGQDKHTPIIVLTAEGYDIEETCRQAGADDFRVKPLAIKDLCLVVDYWLSCEKKTRDINREKKQ